MFFINASEFSIRLTKASKLRPVKLKDTKNEK